MAATVSAWSKPGAWALDAEENETELLKQHDADKAVNNGHSSAAVATSDFPSLSAAAATKTKKKKGQTISLQEFTKYGAPKPAAYQAKTVTQVDVVDLPTGPRERSADELDRSKLGGGFRSYGGRDEQPRRQGGGFNRDSDREFTPSRADETDDWGAGKKSSAGGGGFDRRERGDRGERGGFFSDSQSRADEVDNWGSKKSFVPSEPRRYERRGSFGLDSSNGGSDADTWERRKEEEGRKTGGAFDSLRERRGGSDMDSESWGRKREEGNVGSRPRLNLQPRTLPVVEVQILPVVEVQTPPVVEGRKGEVAAVVVKPKASNPFGEARPREEVLKEKGLDLKEIDEKLESAKIKEVASAGPTRGFWSGNGRERPRVEHKMENAWRKPESVDSPRPQSSGVSEEESAVNNENGHTEVAEVRDTQI